MSSSAPESRLGDVIGGRYRVLAVLGRGGMGVLYTAEHQLTHRRVAVKLLLPDREDLPELHARFLLEARTAAAVRHPNVVDVLDMGVHADGSPFLVMELLEGTSLDRAVTIQKKLTPERTLELALPIIGALASLHDQGIVHRDVKPSNIFLAAGLRGEVEPKLLDFGLARTMSDLRLTRSGMVLGTPLYMSPEQAAGETVNFQTDIWSLGVVLFECLSGDLPFTSRESGPIAAQVLAGRVRGLAAVAPEVPAPLAHAIDRALRRDMSLRYADMRQFARGLVAAAVASGIRLPENPDPVGLPDFRAWCTQASVPSTMAAARPAPATKPTPSDSAVAVSPITGASTIEKKGRGASLAVIAVAIVLAVSAAWAWAAQRQTPPSTTTLDLAAQQKPTPAADTAGPQGLVAPPPAAPTPLETKAEAKIEAPEPSSPVPGAAAQPDRGVAGPAQHAQPTAEEPSAPTKAKSKSSNSKPRRPRATETPAPPPEAEKPAAPAPAKNPLHIDETWQ